MFCFRYPLARATSDYQIPSSQAKELYKSLTRTASYRWIDHSQEWCARAAGPWAWVRISTSRNGCCNWHQEGKAPLYLKFSTCLFLSSPTDKIDNVFVFAGINPLVIKGRCRAYCGCLLRARRKFMRRSNIMCTWSGWTWASQVCLLLVIFRSCYMCRLTMTLSCAGDIWSENGIAMFALTAYLITDDFRFREILLHCAPFTRTAHTGEEIKNLTLRILVGLLC